MLVAAAIVDQGIVGHISHVHGDPTVGGQIDDAVEGGRQGQRYSISLTA